MQKIPDLEKLDLKDITSYGGAMEHGEERAKKHDKAASLYNHVRSEPLALRLAVCMLLYSSLLTGLIPAVLAGLCSVVTQSCIPALHKQSEASLPSSHTVS